MSSDAADPGTHTASGELRRELSLLDSTMINVGSMIGSGIFIVPAFVAMQMQSTLLLILVWVVGGIVSLLGALSVAELGAMMPSAGGQYVYLSRAYGPLWGFLYGWSAFTVINTGSIAAVAVTFATYLGYFSPLNPVSIKLIAIASVVMLTVVNCFGIKLGALVQNGLTFAKIGSLAGLVILGFLLGNGAADRYTPFLPEIGSSTLMGAFAIALIAVLWSYDGWIEITYVAGEVKNPQRVLPRALGISTLIVIGLYAAVNIAYVHVLSYNDVAHSTLVAADTGTRILGPIGASIVTLAVVVSTFGANNGFVFTCPRIYYQMAREGLFFRWLASVHPVYHTPIPSLLVQCGLASFLILTGTFEQLTTYVVFASFLFYAMSAGAVIVLRRRAPEMERPYRTWGYPAAPIAFIGFSMFLVVSAIVDSPLESLIGGGIVLAGVPAYLFWKRKPA